MGCGGSRIVGEDGGNGRIQTLIWRRVGEIRRRRSVALRGPETLSKKELLKGTSEDDNSSKCDSVLQDYEKVSISSQEESLKVSPAPLESNGTIMKAKVNYIVDESVVATPLLGFAKVAKVPEPAKLDNSEKCIEEGGKIDKAREEKEMEAIATAMELMDIMKKTDGDSHDEETDDSDGDYEYGRLSGVNNGCFYPGSPSFRVYFIESLANDQKDDNDEHQNTGKGSEDTERVQESVKSSNSLEETETKIKKKSKRSAGMRFKKAMGKRRPVAMKNLLSVTSCYNPACTSSDKACVLPPKPKAISSRTS